NERSEFFMLLRQDKEFRVWKGDSFPFSEEHCLIFNKHLDEDSRWVDSLFIFPNKDSSNTPQQHFKLSDVDIFSIRNKMGLLDMTTESQQKAEVLIEMYS
ncbi:MAG: hypothetical protein HRT72_12900, partial [Flavobacteriales bacterium]|nr:hypothetical protein [Flavobacteriales bacterium]